MQETRSDRYARKFLYASFYYAKFLGVIDCRFDETKNSMLQVRRKRKCLARFLRILFMIIYMGALANLLKPFQLEGPNYSGSSIAVFVVLQVISVIIFAVFVFIVQTRCELQIIQLINRYLQLYQRVVERCRSTNAVHGMLKRKFLSIVLLKFGLTLIGYGYELPALLIFEGFTVVGVINFIGTLVGVYLWMASMLVLDCCVFGLLVVALMYEEMGNFLRRMLCRMGALEDCATAIGRKTNLSKHKRMKLLCECADIITDCDVIYAELFSLIKQFQGLFQWQIFYYIYYNFMVILLLFHNSIWVYLQADVVDKMDLIMVGVKITNLGILILCADFVVQRFQMPQLLCLDVVCSDIDERWCMSVEAFLTRRQVERLEIKVLGFFQLNNEFICVIMSAIVSYLFIIIQFGLTAKK